MPLTNQEVETTFSTLFTDAPPPEPPITEIPKAVVQAAFEIHKNYQFVCHLMLALGNCYLSQAKLLGPCTKSAQLNAATEALYDTAAFLGDIVVEEKEKMNAKSEQGG